ncbi:MAG: DUF2165 family protein [Verrucomicrobiota bacterium]
MIERVAKTALVAAAAFFLSLVAWNNLVDYGSNHEFVRHVLSMDTTFPTNQLKGRALVRPAIHHAFYAGIIAWEALSAAWLWAASWRLWRARSDGPAFRQAKPLAIAGLVFNLLLWFVAFLTVGGEWFLMWQSTVWNGQSAAFRMFACLGIILLLLKTPEEDARAASA